MLANIELLASTNVVNMPFTEFPHRPQLPPLATKETKQGEETALPLHPLLRPLRSSRQYSQPTDGVQSPDEPSDTQQLLNSERWAHHRTLFTLRNELARRDQLEQQIASIRQESQAVALEWSAATKNLLQCDSERLELLREVQSLRGELESWQIAYQDIVETVCIHKTKRPSVTNYLSVQTTADRYPWTCPLHSNDVQPYKTSGQLPKPPLRLHTKPEAHTLVHPSIPASRSNRYSQIQSPLAYGGLLAR